MSHILVLYRHLADGRRYADAVELAGGRAQLTEAGPGVTLAEASGLLLTGGSDVNPGLYDESPLPETDAPDNDRDAAEGRLIDEALERDIPVLAICRGMQMLNVHLGGTLTQHMDATERHRRRTEDRSLPAHSVNVAPGTLLSNIASTPTLQVNSRHHQAVACLGRGLAVSASAEDGTIEAVEIPGRKFAVAVQWHPEDQAAHDPEQRKLFESFVNACGRPIESKNR